MTKLDEEVEKKFAQRLNMAVRVWVDVLTDRKRKQEDDDSVIRRRVKDGQRSNVDKAFVKLFDEFYGGGEEGLSGIGEKMEDASGSAREEEFAKSVRIKGLVLEILIRNQVLYVSPSVEVSEEKMDFYIIWRLILI